MKEMKIEYKNIGELVPYENNPRFNDEAVKFVANSIKEFGFKVPIIIDKNNVIVAGHTRLKAAEGTYSISKGKNFNSAGFSKYMNEQRKANENKQRMTQKALAEQYYKDRDYNKYKQGLSTAFNDFLVDQHNSLLSGAKTYGYNYTLERKK